MIEADISVVVPSFNRAAMLPETLDAILAQSGPPLEVIVVDDGSTDGTEAMLAERFAGRVQAIRIENSGELVARNTGLRVARGRLVAFCDSDDVWQPGFLAAMAALWRAEPHTRVGYADFTILRDGRHEATRKFDMAPTDYWQGLRIVAECGLAVFDVPIVDRLIRFQPFFPSCMVVQRDFMLGLGGWDESVGRTVGIDFATTLLLAEHTPFGVVRQPLVAIRKHAGNYSADVEAMNLGDATILEHVLARRASLKPFASLIADSVARRRAQALDIAFARQDHAAVRRIFAMLPPGQQDWALRLKARVGDWPPPMRQSAARTLLALGTLRGRVSL